MTPNKSQVETMIPITTNHSEHEPDQTDNKRRPRRNSQKNTSATSNNTNGAATSPRKPKSLKKIGTLTPIVLQDQDDGQRLYKTELCRSWLETGQCRYGDKCQFAHGYKELRPVVRHRKYKSEPCKYFHVDGVCMYGTRCCFIHNFKRSDLASVASQNIYCLPSRKGRLPVFEEISQGEECH
eukprot:gb/GECH01008451.1/.p1 GENE.gb/GECH01008451.1/~~gb/GECH01008451.1/.p1  ORF type:complete len:182 (+),score=32.66 gb/GECH01008451.1/:1-546(+)